MIGRLGITNYKSLRNVDIELGKFNVLVGPNASGKSNFLDSLAFLSETAQKPIGEIVRLRGGFDHVVFSKEPERRASGLDIGEIEFTLFDTVLDDVQYTYFISIAKDRIKEERLSVDDKIAIEGYSGGKSIVLQNDGISTTSGWNPSNYSGVYTFGQSEHDYAPIRTFHDYLSSWRFFQIVTPEIRKTIRIARSFDLEKSGGNLAQVLHTLHNMRPRVFQKIEQLLMQGIPEVEELLTPLTEDGKTYVAIREKGFEGEFDYYQISDGTLNLLSYITAVALPEAKLLCFEEPENFVHARLLQLLVEILKNSEKQIIVSTHSPYLLGFAEPEEVIVVEKEGNETKLVRIENAADLKKRLQDLELSLGEYWFSGAIGGVP